MVWVFCCWFLVLGFWVFFLFSKNNADPGWLNVGFWSLSPSASAPQLLATLPLTGRGNTVAAVRAPSLSHCPSSAPTARQRSCDPDRKLSANQALPALLPFLPSLPSAAQNQAASQAFGHRLTGNTWSLQGHVLVPWDSRIPSSKQPEFTDYQGRNATCSDCFVPRSPGPGPSVSRAKCPCVYGKRWLKPLD